jgi:hypothetical protein
VTGSRGDLEIEAAAPRGGIGDPGPLARQEQAVLEAQAVPPAVRARTGEDGALPPPNGPATSIGADA